MNNCQVEEFKNAISEIIEEKIENIEDPNEKEKTDRPDEAMNEISTIINHLVYIKCMRRCKPLIG